MPGADPAPRRLFVAVTLPAAVRDHLAAAAARVTGRAGRAGERAGRESAVRWSDPASWHLTLVFCGTVAPEAELSFIAGVREVAAQHRTMRLRLAGGGRFGHRVLWVGLAGEHSALVSLAGAARHAARRAGVDVEDRAYRAHLTIARGRPGADLAGPAAALGAYQGPDWTVDELVLYESRLGVGPGGSALHIPVETFDLG